MKRLKVLVCIGCVLSFNATSVFATGFDLNGSTSKDVELVQSVDGDKGKEETNSENIEVNDIKKVEGNIAQDELSDENLKISLDEFLNNKEKHSNGLQLYSLPEENVVKINDSLNIIETNFNWNGELDFSNKPKKLVMHHIEASRPGSTIPVTDIHQWHLNNGWTGIGYHFYVTKDGKVYRGRPENAVGAHAKGVNTESIGIAVEGKYEVENMPEAQKQSVINLGKYLTKKYNMDTILKHKDVNSTDCPGGNYPFDYIKGEILKPTETPAPPVPPVVQPTPPTEEKPAPPVVEEPNTRPIVENDLKIKYQAHGQDYAWQNPVYDGQLAGTEGQWKRIEGLKINLENAPQDLGITYRSHSAGDNGWRDWKSEGSLSGTTGESRRMEAIQIKLTGKMAKNYNVKYRVHVADKGWMPWVSNGETAGTMGQSRRIEGIEIKVESSNAIGVEYTGHGQDYAWQKSKRDGQLAGTVGQWRRLEGIKINLKNAPAGMGIRYSTHSAYDSGWRGWKQNGELSGTTGEGKRMEAIKIELTGPGSELYNIEYRAHGEDYGWQPWVKNGAMAGTMGQSRRIEGLEIRVVKK